MDAPATRIGSMTVMTSQDHIGAPSITGPFATVMTVIFTGYLVIGMAMPVLPLHVHQGLGFGAFLVGLVAGSQFAAAILSRVWAGRQSDTRGPKSAVITGLAIAPASGLLSFLSLSFSERPLNP